ncbi:unnamed protein product [Rhizoctonia solani]|uniref:Uncharacterized protein n=1 Tax=Rhizoctonia solani TaxID=456999 RepID=A0A8H2ZU07_9AGAM|nr:unnamed protein product [Rhizoctonia solani]
MFKFSNRDNTKDRALKEAAKALSVAAKSLALASDALSRLYDTDEEDTSTAETDRNSVSAEQGAHHVRLSQLPPQLWARRQRRHPLSKKAKNIWSEMQNNFGPFETPSKGDTESESGRMVNETLFSGTKSSPGPSHIAVSGPGSQPFFNSASSGNLMKSDPDSIAAPPRSWAHLLKPKPMYSGGSETGASITHESTNTLPTNDKTSDDLKPHTETLFFNLKHRWATPAGLQYKVLRPLRAGSDILLLHLNLKSHVPAILARCIQTLKRDRHTSSSIGAISVLVIVPQQTTGRLFLQHANELLSDFNLPRKAMLLPGGGSDVATEAERMSTERIDILISSPRVFINHVNSNSNISSHLSRIRFVIYAGAHELTRTDAFLGFQFNMIKKRMPTRAKSPRQIIIVSQYTDDRIEVFASRGLHPGYVTIHGTESDDDLQPGSWDALLK